GALTSRLQHIRTGDKILLRTKPTGTLIAGNLLPGKRLYLFSTGTGLAPFISIIQDPEVYEQFEQIILVHGVRTVSELAYQDFIERELPQNEFFGDVVREKLRYYPTVTREPYKNTGRITQLIENGKLFDDLELPQPNIDEDRFMLCGSPAMLKDICATLDARGYSNATRSVQGHYVIERAFVEQG
ncbi:MAG: ferredoxin--NADP reductase, partial [Granulosicoccaceae bacterium]